MAGEEGMKFEISPNTGFMDGSGEFGLDASMNYKAINLEFSAAQVIGETADLYPLMLNLVFNFSKTGNMIPFGMIGTGLFLTVPSTIGSRSVSTLGMNFGGGIRYYFSDDLGIRIGVSQNLTTIKNTRDNFDELLIFQEVTIGFIFVF
jgi:hypothetical protein